MEPGSDTIGTEAPRRCTVSVTQQQVQDALAKVASPRGVALTNANVLSAITVADGKVFFSINVDAAEARAWESVRARAEAAVRAIPGVNVAMIALTAERKPGAAASARAGGAARLVAQAAAKSGVADVEAVRNSRHCRRHRGGLRQGRRRKIDDRAQSGVGPARSRLARRPARRRHLWAIGAEIDRHSREAAAQRRQENDSHSAVRPCDHVDRFSGRRGYRDDLARPDGDVGHHPDAAGCRLGDTRYSRGRYASRYRRRATDAGAERAAEGGGHYLDAAGPFPDRCAAGIGDVQEGQCAGSRHCREYELLPVPALRHTLGHLRSRRRPA